METWLSYSARIQRTWLAEGGQCFKLEDCLGDARRVLGCIFSQCWGLELPPELLSDVADRTERKLLVSLPARSPVPMDQTAGMAFLIAGPPLLKSFRLWTDFLPPTAFGKTSAESKTEQAEKLFRRMNHGLANRSPVQKLLPS